MKAFGVVFLPLLVAYAAALRWIWDLWCLPDSYYSHGPLLPPLALWMVLWWRARWSRHAVQPDAAGWWLLAPGLATHAIGAALTIDSLSAASLVLTVPGAVWLALGRARTASLWPILGLLPLAVPLPLFASGRLAFELKELAVDGGLWVVHQLGLPAVRDGASLFVPGRAEPLLVEDPCGGLRSLLALLTVGYCVAFLLGEGGRKRCWILVAALPLAIGLNVLRIAFLCFAAKWWGVERASTTAHDAANITVWLLALALLVALDRGLSPRGRT